MAPDAITYTALMSAFEKGKEPERALQVFKAMQQQGVVSDAITRCHHLQRLDQCMREGQASRRALQVFEAMQQQGVVPDAITRCHHLQRLVQCMRKGQALELFHAMRQQGVVPDVITYNVLISACEKGRQPGLALQAMQQQGVCVTSSPTTS